jgi:hypothetical protein
MAMAWGSELTGMVVPAVLVAVVIGVTSLSPLLET